MNADKVEHRGLEAFQSMYNDRVLIVKNGKVVHVYSTTERQTADDLRRLIDKHLEGSERDVSSAED